MSSDHFPLRPPWHWHDAFGRKDGKGEQIACGPDSLHGELPMGQCSHFSFAVSDDDGFVIAKCSNALVTMSSDLSESHAILLAAAPELLAAAKQAMTALSKVCDITTESRCGWAMQALDAAITKATTK